MTEQSFNNKIPKNSKGFQSKALQAANSATTDNATTSLSAENLPFTKE